MRVIPPTRHFALFLLSTLCLPAGPAGAQMPSAPAASASGTPSSRAPWLDNEHKWPSDDPSINVRRSEHFRILWGKGGEGNVGAEFGKVTEQLAQGNLQMLEQCWQTFHAPPPAGLGFHVPRQSAKPEERDGNFYRTNLLMNNTGIYEGGAWGSMDDWGYPLFAIFVGGLRFDPPSGATPHEYGHTVLINAGGFNNTPYDGMWHEATANWLMLQHNNGYPGPGAVPVSHFFTLPHGRQYYDTWQIWEYLREQPEYGVPFINKLWTQARGYDKEYIFDAMVRLHPSGSPDPYNAIKDVLGHTATRNLTWDYERGEHFRAVAPLTMDPLNETYRRGTTELVRQPGSDRWYRVPWEHAPSQGGYDIVPIRLNGKTGGGYPVTVDFQPLWDGGRGSDWRACLVAVNDNGEPRYTSLWNTGKNGITLSADENKLFLVVTATPDFMPFEGFARPLLTEPAVAPQAYRVAFVDTAATAYESRTGIPDGVAGRRHPNGGGFVADTAAVAETAYVGPEAMVLDTAQVLGNARIEDFAVVKDRAIVRDNARVSGHALVRQNAEVSGNAKVRDWATVGGRVNVAGNGRVLEHASVMDRVQVLDNATIKGATADFGEAVVKGYAIKDGDCANSANVDRQVLTAWVWGIDQKYADERPDTGGLYCGYDFEKDSPHYAMDAFGVTHGYLMGGPKVLDAGAARGKALKLNGRDQYVEMRRDTFDFRDMLIAMWVNWDGGEAGQPILSFGDGIVKEMSLTPKDERGHLAFTIALGAQVQSLSVPEPLTPGRWTHVAVALTGDTGTLYVDGKPVARSASMTLNPDMLRSDTVQSGGYAAYLGRDPRGRHFAGMLDAVRIYGFPQTETLIASLASNAGSRTAAPQAAVVTDRTPPTPGKPVFLTEPVALDGHTVKMSVARGKDDSGWVEYRFQCTSGGGHDSGWISASQYTDCLLEPGRTYSYTVKMRDRHGNETAASSPVSVTTPGIERTLPAARFAEAPRGISDTAIRMAAARPAKSAGPVEYRFRSPDGRDSGWQSSPRWTDTGRTPGARASYTVQMRNAQGRTGAPSPAASAVARDDTPPARFRFGEWNTLPYATVENRIALRARAVNSGPDAPAKIETDPVEYSFECVEGGGPDSGWITEPFWQTPALPDGAYAYRFRMRDTSPQRNTTGYSATGTVSVSNRTGYHGYRVSQAPRLPEGALVIMKGTVTAVEPDHYVLSRDGASVKVMPRTEGSATDPAHLGREVTVKGGLWNVQGEKRVTWAEVS